MATAVVAALPSTLEMVSEKIIHDQPLPEQESLPIDNYEDGDLLVVSPYHEREHLLDLKTVDTANQLLAKALVGMECQREDYATAPLY